MLTELRLQNFKAWRDTGPMRLAPLTVIFGTNSSGKSSLGHLLLALKQTALLTDRKRSLHLGDYNSLIDLGTFEDCLHDHDLNQALGFSLSWKSRKPLELSDILNPGQTFCGEELTLEAEALLAGEVLVEEKLDGANLGISWGENGLLRAQNRGAYLEPPFRGQFSRLNQWLMQHLASFQVHLPEHVILFGEWCAARHSLDYASLPDWFLVFDVYDSQAQRFWNRERRNDLAARLGLATVPLLKSGRFTARELEALVRNGRSGYREGKLEGIVIRQDGPEWCERRAKLVHPDFVQQIEEHWRSRALEWNELGVN